MNAHKLLIAPVLLGLLLTAACAGAIGGRSASMPAASTSGSADSSSAAQPGGASGQSGGGPSRSTGSAGDVITQPAPEGQRVQRSAQITLEVPDGRFDSVLSNVITLVEQQHKGYISGSQAQADSSQRLRSGEVSFQVPATDLDAVIGEIRKQGTPQNITISGNDVSQQYVDQQARLRNAEAQRDAILALMQQARSVNDTIQIQNQLGQVTGQIEQLRGQIQYLEHSTTFASIAVTIREAAAGPRDEWGLQTAASQALHNIVNVLAFIIVVVGSLLPILIVVGAVGFAAWRFWPRLRRPAGGRAPAVE
jgi:hypothetical protein